MMESFRYLNLPIMTAYSYTCIPYWSLRSHVAVLRMWRGQTINDCAKTQIRLALYYQSLFLHFYTCLILCIFSCT